ncbi:MAG TPA: hypothetical protein VF791_15860 [Pyrinomonadaceae bacterium]
MNITFKRLVNVGLLLSLTFAAVALSVGLFARADGNAPTADAFAPPASSLKGITGAASAPAAATNCPPFSFANNINLARNPSFEIVGPNGPFTIWLPGQPIPPPSAARHWLMHTSNPPGDRVMSRLIPTTVPGPGGSRMLRFVAGGNEGGIVQQLPTAPAKLMFSAWVFVRRGRVQIAPNGGVQGPVAWSTKHNEWEQLRVCTDGSVPTGFFAIYNQDPKGGEFFVDRIEIRETP